VGLVRAAMLISAPIEVVFDLARQAGVGTGLPGVAATRVVQVDRPRRFAEEQERGPWRSMRRLCRFAPTGAGTLVTDELEWVSPLGVLGRLADGVAVRRQLLRLLVARTADLRTRAEVTAAAGPARPALLVVGAALLDGTGRVLAAQRAAPPELAGRWEFPGGKVEPGEGEVAALVRECHEELALTISVGDRLGGDLELDGARGRWVLKIWTARAVSGSLTLADHSDARWLSVDELDSVPWIPADAPLVAALRTLLGG
jgi:8-oxo-dGTP diphosphatase